MGSQSRNALKPEQERQRARDQQQVAEVICEKRCRGPPERREAHAVQSIKQRAREKDRVEAIAERAHGQSANIAMPEANATASASLRIRIMRMKQEAEEIDGQVGFPLCDARTRRVNPAHDGKEKSRGPTAHEDASERLDSLPGYAHPFASTRSPYPTVV